MAATSIPTHASGDVLPAGDWNTLVPLNTQFGIYATGNALAGSGPAPLAPSWLIQAGTATPTTNAGGQFTLTWPSPFPNGLLTFLVFYGDNGADADGVINGAQAASPATATSALCVAYVGSSGAFIANTQIRVNWVAIGF